MPLKSLAASGGFTPNYAGSPKRPTISSDLSKGTPDFENTSTINSGNTYAPANKLFGTSFGNQEGLANGQYMYTDPNTGQQAAMSLNAEQLDAIQNPVQGSGAAPTEGFGGYAGLANAGIGAFNAYNNYVLGKKNLGLAQSKFDFEKASTMANYANQAKLTNNAIQNSGEVGMSLAGNTMNAADRNARQAQMTSMKVNPTLL